MKNSTQSSVQRPFKTVSKGSIATKSTAAKAVTKALSNTSKKSTATKPSRPKKLPEAAIEATAETFLTLFKALPGAIQWRIVQKIEEYEDELDAAQLAADMTAHPEDYDLKNAVPMEQVFADYEAQHNIKL